MTQTNKRPAARRRPAAVPPTPRHAAARKGPIDAALDADLFKALGDPTRLQLLACLAKCARPCSVSEVADCCHVDLSVVSRHLALLQRAGVLHCSRAGRTVHYAVRFDRLTSALRRIADALAACAAQPGACCDPVPLTTSAGATCAAC